MNKPIDIHYPEEMEKEIVTQMFEIWKAQCYKNGLKKDAVYVDVGANIGMSVLYFLDHAKKIYALEPNKEIFKSLEKNVGHLDKVEIFNVGLTPKEGLDYLYSNTGGAIPQSLFSEGNSINTVAADFVTLDGFLEDNNIEHVDVLKVDIESSEYLVFPSSSFGKATPKIDYIIGESHFRESAGYPDMIPTILDEWGYETETIDYENSNYKNTSRKFIFTDPITGQKKTYEKWYNTMFEAKKKKK